MLQCMHENNEEPLKCKAVADDYLECLHHRKYVSSLPSISRQNQAQPVCHATNQLIIKCPK